mmetsp:Transcript_30823/g.64614  ORF Transcript_30823/g.64614 Transcript_30823/m.64614 type:complete len:207 (-) Transcript_30823:92-712(-)
MIRRSSRGNGPSPNPFPEEVVVVVVATVLPGIISVLSLSSFLYLYRCCSICCKPKKSCVCSSCARIRSIISLGWGLVLSSLSIEVVPGAGDSASLELFITGFGSRLLFSKDVAGGTLSLLLLTLLLSPPPPLLLLLDETERAPGFSLPRSPSLSLLLLATVSVVVEVGDVDAITADAMVCFVLICSCCLLSFPVQSQNTVPLCLKK